MLTKKEQRLRRSRQTRIRIAMQGVARLTVNRTNLHIYATVISGDGSKVLATVSTAQADVRTSLGGSGKGGSAGSSSDRSSTCSPALHRCGAQVCQSSHELAATAITKMRIVATSRRRRSHFTAEPD